MPLNNQTFFEHILINYRWIFVCFFLLPISLIFDITLYVRNWIVFQLKSAPKNHHNRVKYVQRQVQDWIKNGKKQKLCTARPGWQTMSFRTPLYKKAMHQINVNFIDILDVNVEKRTVKVEPLVTMGQLTATLNNLGWTIPVVPEMDDLTVGGLIMGTGIESTSHHYGLFQHICVSYELVLADGTVVTCTKDNNPDLFYSIPWSYGTLGILTAVELKLIPAKKFVRLTYYPLNNLDNIVEKVENASRDDNNEFVEALIFNKNAAVLMIGNQVNWAEMGKVNSIGRWYKPWFFKHVEKKLKNNKEDVEYIPLRDYYHRHTKSIFWEIQDIIPFGNNIIFRVLFGWMIPPKVSLLKLTQTDAVKKLYENNHFIQDMLVPIETMKSSIEMFDKTVNIYPLWVCPFKLFQQPGMVHPPEGTTEALYVDIGVYGVPKLPDFHPVETTRNVEKFVLSVKGYQMLYADSYMPKEEFRKMFDHSLYDKVRLNIGAHYGFPEVYDKVNRKARL